MNLIETKVDFENGDGFSPLVIARSQDITPEYLKSLKDAKDASGSQRMGDFHRAASIPVAVYETWLRQGYDVLKEPISKTLAKLQIEGMDAFITTNKAI